MGRMRLKGGVGHNTCGWNMTWQKIRKVSTQSLAKTYSNMGRNRLKWGWGEKVLFWLDARLFQEIGDNREHAWEGEVEQDIQIFEWECLRYQDIWWNLIFFWTFWKIEGLKCAWGRHWLAQDLLILAGFFLKIIVIVTILPSVLFWEKMVVFFISLKDPIHSNIVLFFNDKIVN